MCILTTDKGYLLISGEVIPLPELFDFGKIGCQEVSKKAHYPITCSNNQVWEKSN